MLCIGGSSLATKPNQTISFLVILDQLFNTSFVLRCQAGDWLYNNMNNTIIHAPDGVFQALTQLLVAVGKLHKLWINLVTYYVTNTQRLEIRDDIFAKRFLTLVEAVSRLSKQYWKKHMYSSATYHRRSNVSAYTYSLL